MMLMLMSKLLKRVATNLFQALAPEQGAGPDTVNRTIKLRLLARPTAQVSTAISPSTDSADINKMHEGSKCLNKLLKI